MVTEVCCLRCGRRYHSGPLDRQFGGACPCCVATAALGLGDRMLGVALDAPVQRVGGYELLEPLGGGGMGVVYRAYHPALDREVALKLVRQGDAESAPELAGELDARFEREALALAGLDHPGIVRVHDAGVAEGRRYLVMELVSGGSLQAHLERGRLPQREALRRALELAEALAYAHAQGVIHRDLKPANLLIGADGRLVVADFGLARQTGAFGMTHSQHVLGTMFFAAPEQIERPTQVDHRCDLYSLGVILYQMLTGELPMGRFEMPSALVDGVDTRVDRIVERALEKDPDRRYQRADEVRDDLRGLLEAIEADDLGGPVGRRRPESSAVARGMIAALFGAIALLALLAAMTAGPIAGSFPLVLTLLLMAGLVVIFLASQVRHGLLVLGLVAMLAVVPALLFFGSVRHSEVAPPSPEWRGPMAAPRPLEPPVEGMSRDELLILIETLDLQIGQADDLGWSDRAERLRARKAAAEAALAGQNEGADGPKAAPVPDEGGAASPPRRPDAAAAREADRLAKLDMLRAESARLQTQLATTPASETAKVHRLRAQLANLNAQIAELQAAAPRRR